MDITLTIFINALIGGIAGTLVGLIPFYAGKNKNQTKIGEKAIIACGISGVFLGLILAIPVSIGYTFKIYNRYNNEIICPYCKEHIIKGATICRYCKESIPQSNTDI